MNELDQLRYTYLVSSALSSERIAKANQLIFLAILCIALQFFCLSWAFLIGSASLATYVTTGGFITFLLVIIFSLMRVKDKLVKQDVHLYCVTVRHLREKNFPMDKFYDIFLVS